MNDQRFLNFANYILNNFRACHALGHEGEPDILDLLKRNFVENWKTTTSGMMTVLSALHLCDHVSVYGMGEPEKSGHFFHVRSPAFPFVTCIWPPAFDLLSGICMQICVCAPWEGQVGENDTPVYPCPIPVRVASPQMSARHQSFRLLQLIPLLYISLSLPRDARCDSDALLPTTVTLILTSNLSCLHSTTHTIFLIHMASKTS